MTSKPWMPLYIADYLADTTHLSAFESGAYLHLIMHQWQCGALPTEERALARIAKVQPRYWPRIRAVLAPFFGNPKSGAPWVQKRTAIELRKAGDISSMSARPRSLQSEVLLSAISHSSLQTRSQDSAAIETTSFRQAGPARRCRCRAG
jgi:uncharacterized protein YdaU (DUF1376 family)